MADNNYLGDGHEYFNLSDYELDPHCRYRRRIFRGGPRPWSAQPDNAGETGGDALPRRVEPAPAVEHTQTERWRKRRRESIDDGYTTDGSYAEVPPMSPVSSGASALEGIEDIGDDTDSPNVSDRESPQHSTPTSFDRSCDESIFSPKLPIAARPLPKVAPKLPNATSASSSVVQYSTSRLAERARLASLPTRTEPPAGVQTRHSARSVASYSISSQPYASGSKEAALAESRGNESQSSRDVEFPTDMTRPRRATINGLATSTQPVPVSNSGKHRRISASASMATPDTTEIKHERSSPPLLDLNAPERPYSATHAEDLEEDSVPAVSVADSSRHRKRSKSSASATKKRDASKSAEPEQSTKRSERSNGNPLLKIALESGDYERVTDHKWLCKAHNEYLGGHRSVTRHHESVHLNVLVECEYCSAHFSRRDAMLRHQRSSGCKMIPKQQL